jgi:hypothetical protein
MLASAPPFQALVFSMSHQKFVLTLLGSMSLLIACGAPGAAPTTSNEGGAPPSVQTPGNSEAGALVQDGPNWCDARVVLQAKCQRCHGDPLESGAPFPLLTYADTQATNSKGSPRYEQMKAALEAEYMPPQFLQLTPAVEPLTTDESTTLLTWLSGAPPLEADCN